MLVHQRVSFQHATFVQPVETFVLSMVSASSSVGFMCGGPPRARAFLWGRPLGSPSDSAPGLWYCLGIWYSWIPKFPNPWCGLGSMIRLHSTRSLDRTNVSNPVVIRSSTIRLLIHCCPGCWPLTGPPQNGWQSHWSTAWQGDRQDMAGSSGVKTWRNYGYGIGPIFFPQFFCWITCFFCIFDGW